MATIRITYQLTETGRKAEILAGRPGHGDRAVTVDVTPELLAIATVDHEGSASYSLDKRRGSSCSAYSYDSVLTPEQAAAEALRVEAGLVAADVAKADAAQSQADERNAWIRAHGSARLQKGLALGQLDSMTNVYRDERIAHDLGSEWIAHDLGSEWISWPRHRPTTNDLLNPDESHLDALADALKKWPACGAELKSVEHDWRDWRPALMITCPWADGPTAAIRYLDAE